MTDAGSQFSSLVQGYRMYYGEGKRPTIRPNKRRLASIFAKNATIEWRHFEHSVRKATKQSRKVEERPLARSVYRHPRCSECMCLVDWSEESSHHWYSTILYQHWYRALLLTHFFASLCLVMAGLWLKNIIGCLNRRWMELISAICRRYTFFIHKWFVPQIASYYTSYTSDSFRRLYHTFLGDQGFGCR